MGGEDLYLYLALWVFALVLVAHSALRKRVVGVGLALAYLTHLWLIHWPGALIYTLPWYTYGDIGAVEAGFALSTYGAMAFAFGAVVLAPRLTRTASYSRLAQSGGVSRAWKPDLQLPLLYAAIGIVSYFVLSPLLGGLPSMSAVLSGLNQLLVVGLCLGLWHAWRNKKRKEFLRWLLAALGLPFLTLISQGFLGYGALAFITVLIFLTSFYRPRHKIILIVLLAGYVGLSLYVSYMRDRADIREMVWGGQGLEQRVGRVVQTLRNFEWFDLTNTNHLLFIDARMNQNALVGESVRYFESGRQDYAHGTTLWQALLALIPRAIWPSKPVYAGSPQVVQQF